MCFHELNCKRENVASSVKKWDIWSPKRHQRYNCVIDSEHASRCVTLIELYGLIQMRICILQIFNANMKNYSGTVKQTCWVLTHALKCEKIEKCAIFLILFWWIAHFHSFKLNLLSPHKFPLFKRKIKLRIVEESKWWSPEMRTEERLESSHQSTHLP